MAGDLVPVEDALAAVLGAVGAPVPGETVPLAQGAGRVLAAPLRATRTHPPFPSSAMDGYALRAADSSGDAPLTVIGESRAGLGFAGTVGAGQCVRIFTGAPVPDGADAILIQEHARRDGDRILAQAAVTAGQFVRPAGLDFRQDAELLQAGERLTPQRLALAAAMGHGLVPVRRRPRVAFLATGDELVAPGEPVGPDQIVASNSFAIGAIVEAAGGEPVDLGIAPDDLDIIVGRMDEALKGGCDVLVTLGGASVGDHDLTQKALERLGFTLGFWRIAMRPGKPLIHGRLGATHILGLPGNPVSAIVCGLVFLRPLIRTLLGEANAAEPEMMPARLAIDLPGNDMRQDYMRATLAHCSDGLPLVTPFPRQDSSMVHVLAQAQALVIRPPFAPPAAAGDIVQMLRLPD
jgi:molybdopterin molybdotransferase